MVFRGKIILAIGAHPDDIELGCGGTLNKAILNNQRVVAVFLTKGEKSADPNVRVRESTRALKVLGVTEVHFESFPDAEIPDSFETIEVMEKYALEVNPEVVLTHSINDIHQDHRRVGWLSMAAFRNAPIILAYETPRVRSASFAPNYFVDITGLTETKTKALHCHKSQSSKRYLLYDSTVNLASFRGSQSGAKEAEAFEVVKFLER